MILPSHLGSEHLLRVIRKHKIPFRYDWEVEHILGIADAIFAFSITFMAVEPNSNVPRDILWSN
jgi:hypothetical protein